MFQKILLWIREVVNKMINTASVKQALSVDVAISASMTTALQLWTAMYQNEAGWLNNDIKSLNLPAAIASEIARAVTIEMKVEINGSKRAEYLAEQFLPLQLKLRQMIEFGCAKGGLMLKPYIKDKRIIVDCVQADQFYPVEFDSDGSSIVSCVFSDQQVVGKNYYTRLEYHTMMDKGCVIKNMAYKSTSPDVLGNNVPLTEVKGWENIEPEATITDIDKPLYAYFKYPLANNIDSTSPLGVSCFSRATDLIRQADEQWSKLLWEFESGNRALYVDVLAFKRDSEGKSILPNKRLYRTLETGSSEGELFKEWSPTLREQNLLNGLDAILKRIEFVCGLAYGTLSDPNSIEKTATEIASTKQRSAATVVDTQKALQIALDQLLYAMDVWATIGKTAPAGDYETVYNFDDSIVTDHTLQFSQDTQAVGLGVMSKVEFRIRNYGETEEIAKKKIALITSEQPQDQFANQFQGA